MEPKLFFRDQSGRKRVVEVLFEGERFLILNKPPGVPVIPDRWNPQLPNLRNLIEKRYQGNSQGEGGQSVWIVHRIDADTSGVLLMARDAETHRYLNTLFETGAVEKSYLAIVRGAPPADVGVMDAPLRPQSSKKQRMQVHDRGKPARTEYRIVEKFRHYSLLELHPRTGRTHQIRVHLAALGCPLAVDPVYGHAEALYLSELKPGYRPPTSRPPRPLIARLTLHAHKLAFADPASGAVRIFTAPPPKDFQALLNALQKWNRKG